MQAAATACLFSARRNPTLRTSSGTKPFKDFKGFDVLSWTGDEAHRGAANLFVVGSVEEGNLANAVSDYGYDPVYQLIKAQHRTGYDDCPVNLKDYDLVHSPLKDETVSFSAKIKAPKKSDCPELEINDA